MSFADEVNQFAVNADERANAVFNTTVELTKKSIQYGSELTGAPGQPVDTGALLGAWMRDDVTPTEALITVVGDPSKYARGIEDGISSHGTPMTLRSEVGGFHSVALTVAGFDRIVGAAVKAQGGG